MNATERPPWATPIQYNDAPDVPGPAPEPEGPFFRRGPHSDVMGLDDDDEIDPPADGDDDDDDLDD